MIGFLHVGIAAATKTPELQLSDDESKLLATNVANVMDQFDIRPDPKTEAIVGLLIACGTIYGPRIYVIRARKMEEREKSQSNVAIFPGSIS